MSFKSSNLWWKIFCYVPALLLTALFVTDKLKLLEAVSGSEQWYFFPALSGGSCLFLLFSALSHLRCNKTFSCKRKNFKYALGLGFINFAIFSLLIILIAVGKSLSWIASTGGDKYMMAILCSGIVITLLLGTISLVFMRLYEFEEGFLKFKNRHKEILKATVVNSVQ